MSNVELLPEVDHRYFGNELPTYREHRGILFLVARKKGSFFISIYPKDLQILLKVGANLRVLDNIGVQKPSDVIDRLLDSIPPELREGLDSWFSDTQKIVYRGIYRNITYTVILKNDHYHIDLGDLTEYFERSGANMTLLEKIDEKFMDPDGNFDPDDAMKEFLKSILAQEEGRPESANE